MKEIEAHAGDHDWETQMQVELVESERRLQPGRPVSNLMQYLINQHYQQMRVAFPEIYSPEEAVDETTEQPEALNGVNQSPGLELNHDLSAELDLSINGHPT